MKFFNAFPSRTYMAKINSEEYYTIIISFLLIFSFFVENYLFNKKIKSIKVALCTVGKKDNFYARQFMDYYIKLGVEHMFIYDNNEAFNEKLEEVIDSK